MSAMSDYLEVQLLNHVLRSATYADPATVYLALFTASPTDTGSYANEVPNANAYARVNIGATSAIGFSAAASPGGTTSNANPITFATATPGAWGTITHIGITDSATHGAGNLLFYGALTTSRTVSAGDTFEIPTGQLTVTLR